MGIRKSKFFKSKKLWAFVLLLLAIVFLPYLWSRICSSSNQLLVFEDAVVDRQAASDSIRVACYNIAHGRGPAESNWNGGDAATRLSRLDDIAELLKKLNADVVVLNEVDFDASWSNNVNQAEYLAGKAGYPFRVEERNLDFRVLHRTWRFGNAILSRYPVSNSEVLDLPSYASLETVLAGKKRGVACDVTIGEQTIKVIGLYLSHRSEDVREKSAKRVVRSAEVAKIPVVIMGDMNSTPPSFPQSNTTEDNRNAIKTFDESDLLIRNEPTLPLTYKELTFRSDQPRSIIDWIFVSRFFKLDLYVVEPSQLSDHRPVVAEVSW